MSSGGPGGCCPGPAPLPMQPEPGCVVTQAVTHLPAVKQRQLCAITRIIRATADVERVILFGSHARGDWVEDPTTGFISDFDVLVLVANPALAADEALWADCQERAREVAGDTPVSLIVHTAADVRQLIARGSSFFRDVMTEGVALYDAGHVAITLPELTPAQRLELAQASFTRYFEHAAQLYRSFEVPTRRPPLVVPGRDRGLGMRGRGGSKRVVSRRAWVGSGREGLAVTRRDERGAVGQGGRHDRKRTQGTEETNRECANESTRSAAIRAGAETRGVEVCGGTSGEGGKRGRGGGGAGAEGRDVADVAEERGEARKRCASGASGGREAE